MAGFANGVWLSLLVAAVSAGRPARDEAEYRERAGRFVARHGLELAEGEALEPFLEHTLARAALGSIELCFPADCAADRAANAALSTIALDLVDLQGEWIVWASGDGTLPAGWKDLRKALATAIGDWKKLVGPQAKGLAGREVLEELGAKDALAAAKRLAAETARALGSVDELPRAHLILLPTREDFVEFAALVALLAPRHRASFWTEDLASWVEFRFDDRCASALEYASPDWQRDYRQSLPMTFKNPKGMREQVGQIAARGLIAATSGDGVDPVLQVALANNLIIALHGEVDTRTDGDVRSRTTAERSVFVPGGQEGGTLPPISADSRWREGHGKDHFIAVLAHAQAKGAEKAKERWQKSASFELQGDQEADAVVVRAPFFGAGASPAPEAAFLGDYAELLRAYRVAFLDWLHVEAAGNLKESRHLFGQLLRTLRGKADLLASIQEVYGKPLSATDPAQLEQSLEGRFLAWLARQ